MQLKMLESTPRSLKRLVELNEKTPTTSTKKDTQNIPPNSSDSSCSKKRTFSEMIEWDDDADPKLGGSDLKRPNLETKGRRLFSPQAGTSNEFQSLSTILEELHSPPNNNTNFQNLSPTKKSNLLKKQLNIIRSPEMSKVYPHSPMQGKFFTN